MPLIIVTGLPCSGKTYRAHQLRHEFESRIAADPTTNSKRNVVFIPSHHASLDPPPDFPIPQEVSENEVSSSTSYSAPSQSQSPRDEIYNSAKFEKTARAEEFSAIKRALNKNTVVISDAPNYIKGFRYQLWCEAKAAATRCVVLHAAAREDECEKWNNARIEAWGWDFPTDQEEQAGDTWKVSGPKVGRDVQGDLVPESHTAIYGDKIIHGGGTRSRSSSMGATGSDDEVDKASSRRADDTMTLKSLYITKHPDAISPSIDSITATPTQPTPTPAAPIYPLPISTPPSPHSSLPYSPSTFRSLSMRYEPPSPFTRWDTPLFTIPTHDSHPPYTDIWTALFPEAPKPTSKRALAKAAQAPAPPPVDAPSIKPNAATLLPSATSATALQLLESTTGEVVKAVLAAAREAGVADVGEGGEIVLDLPSHDAEGGPIEVALEVPEGVLVSQPVLQRLRRKYTQIQRGGIAHGQGYVTGRREVVGGFVRFVEAEWEGT